MEVEDITKKLLVITLLLIVTLVLGYPLVCKGYLNGADLRIHLLWTQQFLRSLHSGYLYPQWVNDINLGCGDPSFIFYPPLTFFIAGLLNLFIKEVMVLLSISVLLGLFLSGVTMYVFCRVLLEKIPALLASVAYMALPYHLFDLYARSALAEHWAFVWLPMICFFAVNIRKKPVVHSMGLSVAYGALVVTHLPTALLFSLFLSLFFLFLFLEDRNKKFFLFRIGAIGFGLGFSSLYLIPALFEQKFVNIVDIHWHWYAFDNFLFSKHPIDVMGNEMLSRMALGTLWLSFGSVIAWVLQRSKSKERLLSIELFFAIAGVLSFLVMLSVSKPFWEIFFLIKWAQFPWRFLSISTLCASICLGFTFERLIKADLSSPRGVSVVIGTFLLGLIVLNGWYSFRIVHSFEHFSFDEINLLGKKNWSIRADLEYGVMAKNYQLYYKDNYGLRGMTEYKPLWSLKRSLPAGPPQERTSHYERYGSYIVCPPSESLHSTGTTDREVVMPYEMLEKDIVLEEGKGEIRIVKWEPEERVLEGLIRKQAKILVKTFYYPRWHAYLNGRYASIEPHAHTGLIEIDVPEGRHIIELRFEASRYRRIGILLSVISFGTGLVILGGKRCLVRLRRR